MKRTHMLHALIALAVLVAGWLIYRTLAQYSWDDIRASLAAIPKGNFALALAFAAIRSRRIGQEVRIGDCTRLEQD